MLSPSSSQIEIIDRSNQLLIRRTYHIRTSFEALTPHILFSDIRSRQQSRRIVSKSGLTKLRFRQFTFFSCPRLLSSIRLSSAIVLNVEGSASSPELIGDRFVGRSGQSAFGKYVVLSGRSLIYRQRNPRVSLCDIDTACFLRHYISNIR